MAAPAPAAGGGKAGDAKDKDKDKDKDPRGKMLLVCYLCGRQFGTQSLGIHAAQCYEKYMMDWERTKPVYRGPRPEDPVDAGVVAVGPGGKLQLAKDVPTSLDDDEAVEVWNEVHMDKFLELRPTCDKCGRGFTSEALMKHRPACKGTGVKPPPPPKPTPEEEQEARERYAARQLQYRDEYRQRQLQQQLDDQPWAGQECVPEPVKRRMLEHGHRPALAPCAQPEAEPACGNPPQAASPTRAYQDSAAGPPHNAVRRISSRADDGRRCPACHTVDVHDATFCSECGVHLPHSGAGTPSRAQAARPHSTTAMPSHSRPGTVGCSLDTGARGGHPQDAAAVAGAGGVAASAGRGGSGGQKHGAWGAMSPSSVAKGAKDGDPSHRVCSGQSLRSRFTNGTCVRFSSTPQEDVVQFDGESVHNVGALVSRNAEVVSCSSVRSPVPSFTTGSPGSEIDLAMPTRAGLAFDARCEFFAQAQGGQEGMLLKSDFEEVPTGERDPGAASRPASTAVPVPPAAVPVQQAAVQSTPPQQPGGGYSPTTFVLRPMNRSAAGAPPTSPGAAGEGGSASTQRTHSSSGKHSRAAQPHALDPQEVAAPGAGVFGERQSPTMSSRTSRSSHPGDPPTAVAADTPPFRLLRRPPDASAGEAEQQQQQARNSVTASAKEPATRMGYSPTTRLGASDPDASEHCLGDSHDAVDVDDAARTTDYLASGTAAGTSTDADISVVASQATACGNVSRPPLHRQMSFTGTMTLHAADAAPFRPGAHDGDYDDESDVASGTPRTPRPPDNGSGAPGGGGDVGMFDGMDVPLFKMRRSLHDTLTSQVSHASDTRAAADEVAEDGHPGGDGAPSGAGLLPTRPSQDAAGADIPLGDMSAGAGAVSPVFKFRRSVKDQAAAGTGEGHAGDAPDASGEGHADQHLRVDDKSCVVASVDERGFAELTAGAHASAGAGVAAGGVPLECAACGHFNDQNANGVVRFCRACGSMIVGSPRQGRGGMSPQPHGDGGTYGGAGPGGNKCDAATAHAKDAIDDPGAAGAAGGDPVRGKDDVAHGGVDEHGPPGRARGKDEVDRGEGDGDGDVYPVDETPMQMASPGVGGGAHMHHPSPTGGGYHGDHEGWAAEAHEAQARGPHFDHHAAAAAAAAPAAAAAYTAGDDKRIAVDEAGGVDGEANPYEQLDCAPVEEDIVCVDGGGGGDVHAVAGGDPPSMPVGVADDIDEYAHHEDIADDDDGGGGAGAGALAAPIIECPGCGALVRFGARFCRTCGGGLAGVGIAPGGAGDVGAPQAGGQEGPQQEGAAPHPPVPVPAEGGGGGSEAAPLPPPAAPLEGEKPPDNEVRVSCEWCGRSFLEDRIAKHEPVCKKQTLKRRERDMLREQKEKEKKAREPAPKPAPKSTWREKTSQLRAAMRNAREVDKALKAGKDLKDIPQPPPEENDDRVSCPYCHRKFAQQAADRHIPLCAKMKSRPRPVNKKTKAAAGAAGGGATTPDTRSTNEQEQSLQDLVTVRRRDMEENLVRARNDMKRVTAERDAPWTPHGAGPPTKVVHFKDRFRIKDPQTAPAFPCPYCGYRAVNTQSLEVHFKTCGLAKGGLAAANSQALEARVRALEMKLGAGGDMPAASASSERELATTTDIKTALEEAKQNVLKLEQRLVDRETKKQQQQLLGGLGPSSMPGAGRSASPAQRSPSRRQNSESPPPARAEPPPAPPAPSTTTPKARDGPSTAAGGPRKSVQFAPPEPEPAESPAGVREPPAGSASSTPSAGGARVPLAQRKPTAKQPLRNQSEQLRFAVNMAKMYDDDLKAAGAPKAKGDDARTPCPYCGRNFASAVAQRHIPKCAATSQFVPTKKPSAKPSAPSS